MPVSNPVTVTVSESNALAGASVTVTVTNAAVASGAGKTIVSSGGIADLTSIQQGEVGQGTIVVTTDGYRYVYSGAGSKTDPASYVILADITPDWSSLSGKPSTFAPSAHAAAHGSGGADAVTLAVSQVTGLQAALDGKQESGSYAAASHDHAVADVTGLQDALDGKQASGSYADASHAHAISDVTGLQTALDGKQASGSYAAASHTHSIGDVTNLQTSLDGKVSSAPHWTSGHTSANGTQYNIGDLVYYSGNIYRAIATNDSIVVGDTSYWALVGPGYSINIAGADIAGLPSELPSTASDGDVLTYDTGTSSWVAAAPSGGGGSFPSTSLDGALAVYSSSLSAWTTSDDAMNLGKVVLHQNDANTRVIVTDAPTYGVLAIRLEDGGDMNNSNAMEISTVGLVFPDNSIQQTAGIAQPATPNGGDVLTYDSGAGTWIAQAPSGGLPSGNAEGEVLTWSSATSSWSAQGIPAQVPTSASTNDILSWNGSSWVAVLPSTPGLPSGSTGQYLTYDGTNWVAGNSPLPTGPNEFDIVQWNGSSWTNGRVTVADWSQSISYLTNDLVHSNGQIWRASPGGMGYTPSIESTYWTPLTAAPVTPLPSGNNGDVLTYNATNSAWESQAPSAVWPAAYGVVASQESNSGSAAISANLQTVVAGSATYEVEGMAIFYTDINASGEYIEFGLQLSAGTSDGAVYTSYDYHYDAYNAKMITGVITDQSTTVGVGGFDSTNTGSAYTVRFKALVLTGAISSSTLGVYFGRSGSSGTTVDLQSGSWFVVRRIA
jgi:hypothetical protein